MVEPKLIDTFPEFLDFWDHAQHHPIDTQIEQWRTVYMSHWPELLSKQLEDYAQDNLDWQEIAREHVFSALSERFPLMVQARQGLLSCIQPAYQRTKDVLGLDFDVTFVIYVGIGLGAGWATSYQEMPACLYGLENIAECGWIEPEALEGLTTHELGHLLHQQWRARDGLSSGKGPLWDIYEEGFAQRCEHIAMGQETWHMQNGKENWLPWCHEHQAWLASEFLQAVERQEPVTRFFGSWFDIQGHSQCGYFLGHQIIREWQAELDLGRIARLPLGEMKQRVKETLREMSGR